MPSFVDPATSRRRFLQFLAGSPLFAAGAGWALAEPFLPKPKQRDPSAGRPLDAESLISNPKDAINVFDFEPVMRRNVPPAHFGYMASGIDDEVTMRANRDDFLKFQLRPRRLVDVSKVDMSTEILGVKYETPIIIAPVGGQRMYHPEGEIATRQGGESRKPPADPLYQHDHRGRRCYRRPRRRGLVPALRHEQMGSRESLRDTRGKGGLPGGRGDGRSHRRSQPGDFPSAAAHRHAKLFQLPRPQQPAGGPQSQVHV